MTNFEFYKLYSLIGKDINDPEAKGLFNSIYNEYKDSFIIHQLEEKDIENDRDNWICFDSQELGIAIEVVCGTVACISFLRGFSILDEPKEITAYPYPLYNDLKLGTTRKEVLKINGTPKKESEFFDQYEIDNNITMGILYNQNDNLANTISFGLTEIFSDPDRTPNRISFIFMSLF